MPPTTRAGASFVDSSEDEDFMRPPSATRSTRRLAGGGARGAPAPSSAAARRAATAAQRGRPAAAATRATRGARGRASTSRATAPIVGGRQNEMARRATRVRDAGARGGAVAARGSRRGLIAGAGHAYRIGRRSGSDESAGDITAGTIELSSDDDDEEEGDDVDDDDEDEEEEMGADDSLRDFIENDEEEEEDSFFDESELEGADFPADPMGPEEGEDGWDGMDDFLREIEVLRRRHPLGGLPLPAANNRGRARVRAAAPLEESFSQENEEFELMEERDSAAARKREEQLRKKEDKEEKENKNVLRTEMFGPCTVCAEEEVVDPVGCIHCANFIGCRKCTKRWYRTSKQNAEDKIASCPFCRHEWPEMPEVGDQLDLVKSE